MNGKLRSLFLLTLITLLGLGLPSYGQEKSAADVAVEAAKKFKGVTLRVMWEAGLQAQDPLVFSGPLWEQLTGIKVQTIETPFPELFSKMVTAHLAGSGDFDVISYVPAWQADLVEAGVLEPIDAFLDKYMPKGTLDDIHPTYQQWLTFKGKRYGIFDDGDTFTMYYRKDLFGDKANQEAYKAKYGQDLRPPQTWKEWDQICAFFKEKLAANGGHGCAIQRTEGQAYFWAEEQLRVNGVKFFDPGTMKATINNEAGVKTFTDMVNQNKNMPPGVEKWGFIEVFSAWMDGKVAMIISWPPPGRWSQGYGKRAEQLKWMPETKVIGKVGYALPPGGHPQLAAGFNLGVSTDSPNKEAAYLYIQWATSKEISLQRVQLPYALRDPYRNSHYASKEYRAQWDNAGEYLDTLKLGAEKGLLDLSIPGAREYEEALDRAIVSTYAGTSPKQALDKAAAEWDAITQRIGVDKQREAYKDWASKPNAYPK
jgi:multiple sugar transport system substrate-binding protein